jgi:signal transduction histidine kinase
MSQWQAVRKYLIDQLQPQGALIAITYSVALWASFAVRVIGQLPPIIWLANGVGIAALILCGLRFWPWMFLAELTFRLIRDAPNSKYPILTCLISSAGITFGQWLGVSLFLKRSAAAPTLTKQREVLHFLFFVLVIGLGVGVAAQMLALQIADIRPLYSTAFAWKAWWINGCVGAIVLGGGAVLYWNDTRKLGERLRFDWQIASALMGAFIVGIFSFTPLARYNDSTLLREYLFFPMIMWASLRWDVAGAMLVSAVAIVCATIGVLTHFVPGSIFETIQDQILFHQFFILNIVITGWIFAAAIRERAEANLAKSQFLANVSHEIRTPLGVVLGFADLFATGDGSIEERQSHLRIMDRNRKRLMRVIDDILDFSNIERKKVAIKNLEFSVNELINEAVMQFLPAAKAKKIELILDSEILPENRVTADPIRIRQVIDNLVGNAIKFTEKGKVEISVRKSDDYLHICVLDTGIGISDEYREALFEPFTQADESITRRFGGTGLGLSLSKKIAQQMGGDLILIDSQLGKGSVFEFTILINH